MQQAVKEDIQNEVKHENKRQRTDRATDAKSGEEMVTISRKVLEDIQKQLREVQEAKVRLEAANSLDSTESEGLRWSTNENDEVVGEINATKRVTIRKFREKIVLADIREYYQEKESGEMKPGRKGISLTIDQIEKVAASMPRILSEIRKLQK